MNLGPGTTMLQASAGTGKTWRVVDVLLRLVMTEAIPVQRVLVVTFTDAATAELRTRVRARLRDAWLAAEAALEGGEPPADPRIAARLVEARDGEGLEVAADRCRRALEDFDEAPITTIHTFCKRVLERHAFESGAPFARLPIADSEAVIEEIVRDVWVRQLSALPDRLFRGLQKQVRLDDLMLLARRIAADPDMPVYGLAPADPPVPEDQRGAAWHHTALERAVVVAMRDELPRRLRRLHVRTYDDLLRAVRDGVVHPGRGEALREAVRQRYEVALVDEFQDTDPVQWEVFRELFGERRLLLIGDPKQAIYGFRGADLQTYLIAQRAAEVSDIGMRDNHRSDGGLVRAINHLFGRSELREPFASPHMHYASVRPVHPESRLVGYGGAPLELRFIERRGGPLEHGRLHRYAVEEPLAALVAHDVTRTLAAGLAIDEDGLQRAVSPRDCAVLVRSNAQAAAVQAALRQLDIPSVVRVGDNVLKSPLAGDLAAVLAAIVEPRRGPIARALVTPLLGYTANGLAELQADDAKWSHEVERFRRWHATWNEEGFARVFRDLLDEGKVTLDLMHRTDGERQVTDLLHLGELLHEHSLRRRLRPAAVVAWLLAGGKGVEDDQAKARLESDGDAVEVSTVHSAKGLEYPLVWVPYLWRGTFVGKRDKRYLRFHHPDTLRRSLDVRRRDHPRKRENLDRAQREELAEALRLTYVAVTRAKHRCVLYCGSFHNGETSSLAWLLHQPSGVDVDKLWGEVKHRVRRSPDTDLIDDLEGIAAGSEGAIAVTRARLGPREVVSWPRVTGHAPLRARDLHRAPGPDRWWRRSSFSALVRGATHGGGPATRDLDEAPSDEADDAAPTGAPALDERVPLADFVGGTRAGTFFHRVLELHDFGDPAALPALVRVQLALHGLDPSGADLASSALQSALATPLDDGDPPLSLAALTRADRLDELEFYFPVAGGFEAAGPVVTPAALADAFRPHPYADVLAELPFAPLRGFVTGSIDLVFRWKGRFYLADYKSNRLGQAWADYAQAPLDAAMADSNYLLQAHLYTVALHRYLRLRMPGYSYDDHLGGVYYLFMRGMAPDRPGSGVWFERPPRARVEALDALLRGGR